jgi:nitrite reductase/ring-hydroxylating ferredoxin subunit
MADFVTVAQVSDFREGKIRRYFVDGREIGVVLWRDRWHAFSNRCTHQDFQMHFGYVEDDSLHCPIHFAVFELATGARTGGPWSIDDLPVYDIRVEGNDVQVSLG